MHFYVMIGFIIYILKPVRRESLLPPIPSLCNWKDYVSSPVGQHPILAREVVCKNTTRGFKATVAMVCVKYSIPCTLLGVTNTIVF